MSSNQTYTIPLSKPFLRRSDWKEIKACFDSTWISSKSPWVEHFEDAFASTVSHTKYAVSVNSGTSALIASLLALGIGRGDEVILPTFTMVATLSAVIMVGATPVLVDSVASDDWNMDIDKVEELITHKTKAIIAVHIYGYSCDMQRLMEIGQRNKLHIIEDAAEAMGSEYNNRRLGSYGVVGCFSLYSNKIITTGNGGMIVTNDQSIANLLKKVRFFDFGEFEHFVHNRVGYNFALSGIQAALGLSQVRQFTTLLSSRQRINGWYRRSFSKYSHIKMLDPIDGLMPNYWFPAIMIENQEKKQRIISRLEEHRIETRSFFCPMHMQPAFEGMFSAMTYPHSEDLYGRGILLPSYKQLKRSEVQLISDIIVKST
jgi:perosamine synthetase